ncbi:MAG: hypothetical protein IJ064_06350 [Bacteroidaceae bacterium]|nr:hypothetical protein [Bacteroidaceae bacterium]
MKRHLFLLTICLSATLAIQAQQETSADYRRSSLYSVMVNHTDQKFADEIKTAFLDMEIPDKYNDHDLSVKVLDMDKKLKGAKSDRENAIITDFLNNNNVGSRLVAKWFNRDAFTGQCDVELVKERGLYNASEFDKAMADRSQRARALLEDAGEDLIGNTFVLVNDIRYIDKSKKSKGFATALRVLGQVAGAATGVNVSDLTDNLGDMIETIKGFKVGINTFLYQLVWDEATSATFYQNHFAARPDEAKRQAFEAGRGTYKLKFVGKVESKGSTTSFMGIKENEPQVMVLKACTRAIDENVADLGHEVEAFRVKVPLLSTEPLTAPIGMKEGISKNSRFEVLEINEDPQTGKRTYKRVGVIQPISSLIWDNRFMAVEEGAPGATLGHTTFKKVSGGDFYPGMLIREIASK